ncbi:L-selectin-like [Symphorus nematophorus]
MDRILLGVFYLTGWHIFSSSHLLRQYHYVADPMNWTEAQAYCRENYTDLATIETTEETNQLMDTVSSFGYNSTVWIGLYTNINWTWSDGYRETGAGYRNWEQNEPDSSGHRQFCVGMNKSGKLLDDKCSSTFPFICYRGKGIRV